VVMSDLQDHGCARSPVASEGDDTDAGHERVLGIVHLPGTALTEQLPNGLGEIEAAACKTRLARGNLTAASVKWKGAFVAEVGAEHEIAPLSPPAEAKVFELHEHRDCEIVIGLEHRNVMGLEARLRQNLWSTL